MSLLNETKGYYFMSSPLVDIYLKTLEDTKTEFDALKAEKSELSLVLDEENKLEELTQKLYVNTTKLIDSLTENTASKQIIIELNTKLFQILNTYCMRKGYFIRKP